jgi:hypothetical protein
MMTLARCWWQIVSHSLDNDISSDICAMDVYKDPRNIMWRGRHYHPCGDWGGKKVLQAYARETILVESERDMNGTWKNAKHYEVLVGFGLRAGRRTQSTRGLKLVDSLGRF